MREVKFEVVEFVNWEGTCEDLYLVFFEHHANFFLDLVCYGDCNFGGKGVFWEDFGLLLFGEFEEVAQGCELEWGDTVGLSEFAIEQKLEIFWLFSPF